MSSFKINNLLTPTEANDAVTKACVDGKTDAIRKRLVFDRIKINYKPSFWISSSFPFGLDEDQLTFQDLSGTGLTISGGTVTRTLATNANTYHSINSTL